jgi:hypothetical protein
MSKQKFLFFFCLGFHMFYLDFRDLPKKKLEFGLEFLDISFTYFVGRGVGKAGFVQRF